MKYEKLKLILANPEECCAMELTTKVAEMFESRGYEVTANLAMLREKCDDWGIFYYSIGRDNMEIGSRYISIRNVYRHNGTDKDVSTEIELLERASKWSSSRVERVKITKGSGERAINNKINKILEKF